MSAGRYFLDTNVLVYTFDPRAPAKQRRAREFVRESLTGQGGVISVAAALASGCDRLYSEDLQHGQKIRELTKAEEALGGIFIVRAADYEEAVQLARSSPHARYGARTEVREIQVLG